MASLKKHIFLIFIIIAVISVFLSGCDNSNSDKAQQINSLDDINESTRIGLLIGAIDESVFLDKFPNSQPFYYNSISDEISALIGEKIDVLFCDELVLQPLLDSIEGIDFINQPVYQQQLSAIFAKSGEKSLNIYRQFNEYVKKQKQNGSITKLRTKWRFEWNSIDFHKPDLPDKNGILVLATGADTTPYTYIKDGEPAGVEIDLFYSFCEEYGYQPEIKIMGLMELLPAVTGGKADFALSSFAYSDEAQQSVNFSQPYTNSNIYPVIRKTQEKGSFFQNIVNSFRKTFIVEQRYKLILKGILTTVLITMISAVVGSCFGFLIYIICRKTKGILTKICNGISWVLRSLPAIVLILVLFYVIFGNTNITGFWVSVIAFSLSVAFSFYSEMDASVKSVDFGQLEGAYSLGCSDLKAFFMIILPQALGQFLPAYKGLLLSLLQGTAIVGYIAVEDLTKISDIIRGRTFDAFFPLISTALIYLFLCWLISLILKRIEFKFDSKQRSRTQVMKRFQK